MRSRFYFDLRRNGAILTDTEGDDVDAIGDAEDIAVDVATAMAREQFGAGPTSSVLPVVVAVRDAARRQIFKITLTVTIERPGAAI